MTETVWPVPMSRRRQQIREEWWEYVEATYRRAEAECNGVLLDRRRAGEFHEMYGVGSVKEVLFNGGPAAIAYFFASEELVGWWDQNPRLTWSEFASQAGVADAATNRIARKAPGNRAAAASLAWERLRSRSVWC